MVRRDVSPVGACSWTRHTLRLELERKAITHIPITEQRHAPHSSPQTRISLLNQFNSSGKPPSRVPTICRLCQCRPHICNIPPIWDTTGSLITAQASRALRSGGETCHYRCGRDSTSIFKLMASRCKFAKEGPYAPD